MVKAKQDQWKDAPKHHRPTPEQRKRAHYSLHETERKGIKKAINQDSTPLRRALRSKKLTADQVEAGERFEELYVSVWGRSGSRDSLDQSPRGGVSHEADSQQLYICNQKKRLDDLQFAMDAYTARVLHSVCVAQEKIGDCRPQYKRYAALVAALDIAVQYFKRGKRRKI